jgi:hypothetical protein
MFTFEKIPVGPDLGFQTAAAAMAGDNSRSLARLPLSTFALAWSII